VLTRDGNICLDDPHSMRALVTLVLLPGCSHPRRDALGFGRVSGLSKFIVALGKRASIRGAGVLNQASVAAVSGRIALPDFDGERPCGER